MARKRRSRRSAVATVQRYPSRMLSPRHVPSAFDLWRSIGDRREFHPLGDYQRARSIGRLAESSITAKPVAGVTRGSRGFSHDYFRFVEPQRVVICARRKERREVLFAKRKTGKGARSAKRRNYYSEVHC